jgi:hypothetical protein
MKTQEYKRTPNMYDWLPDYDAFTANFLLELTKPTTIKGGDPIGIVVPVMLPKQFTLEELKPRGRALHGGWFPSDRPHSSETGREVLSSGF